MPVRWKQLILAGKCGWRDPSGRQLLRLIHTRRRPSRRGTPERRTPPPAGRASVGYAARSDRPPDRSSRSRGRTGRRASRWSASPATMRRVICSPSAPAVAKDHFGRLGRDVRRMRGDHVEHLAGHRLVQIPCTAVKFDRPLSAALKLREPRRAFGDVGRVGVPGELLRREQRRDSGPGAHLEIVGTPHSRHQLDEPLGLGGERRVDQVRRQTRCQLLPASPSRSDAT